ncbi:MAG: glycosyltransferase [Pirellulales bacterium]|nr:glycosyltransferase [Pirellulales bacterium]
MKILYVCLSYVPACGAPAELRYLASILAQKGHEVSVYTTTFFSYDQNLFPQTEVQNLDGVKVHYFRRGWSSRTFVLSPELNETLRREIGNFDVVHLYGFRSLQTTAAARIARKAGVPYVITGRGSLTYEQGNRRYKRLYDAVLGRSILHHATKCLPFNEFEKKQFVALGVADERIETIPLGIDPTSFADLPERGAFRAQHGLGDRPMALFLGRFHPIKGLDLLVPAVARAVRELPELCVCLAGSDDGVQREIEAQVARHGLADNIRFVGHLRDRDKLQALVDSDLLVLPSRYDLFPNVLCEAWACRRPVVVCEGCGIADLVRDRQLGLVARFDEADLAEKLLAAARDPDWRQTTGELAYQFVTTQLDSREIAERHERLYASIVERRMPAHAIAP